jgi:RNA polymerase sigma factor (sigma-70 family)
LGAFFYFSGLYLFEIKPFNRILTQQEFKALFDQYFLPVRNYLLFRSGNTELATDLAQETFLKVWEKQDKIKSEKVKGLIFKIAGDLFISHYRKEQRSFNFFNSYQRYGETLSPEDEMMFEQLKQNYSNILQVMPEKQRTVFLMSRVDNLKYTEIAEINGISVKAVEKRMNKALEFLKVNLKVNE